MISSPALKEHVPGVAAQSWAGVRVFVLIDALGWSYLENREFLDDLLPHRQPLRTVLGFSSGAIPSILTGLTPAQNGHWNLFYLDPENSPFRWLRYFLFLPDFLLDTRVTRKLLKEMGRRLLGLGPLFECSVSPRLLPWFNYVEKRNIYAAGGITGAPSIFDQMSAEGKPYHVYSYHRFTDAQALEQARLDLRQWGNGFYFLYLSEMDSLLHHHCMDPRKIDEKLGFYADELRKLFALARAIDPEAAFTLFSDHGMTPVHAKFDLLTPIEALGFSMPRDYLAVYDSTMARFWFFNERARRAISAVLEESRCGRILADAELRGMGIYFDDARYGQLIYLLHPGWLLARSDFNGTGWNPTGMHGYHPDDPYSDGIFLSNAPAPVDVRCISDVYHCMRVC